MSKPSPNDFNIIDNNVLVYDCDHICCGRIDKREENYDVYVFASPFYYLYVDMIQGDIPFDMRLYKCRDWVWTFHIHNS
jgi:hypothetical protein